MASETKDHISLRERFDTNEFGNMISAKYHANFEL